MNGSVYTTCSYNCRVECGDMYAGMHSIFLSTQQLSSIDRRDVNGATAQLTCGQWPPSDWQVNGNTYTWLCHGSSCFFKETVSECFVTV